MSKTLSFVGLSNIYICIYVVWLKNINLVIITYRKQFVNNGISVCEAPSEAMWWNHVSLRPCVQVMWHVRCLGVDELGVSELHGMSRVRYRGRKWGIHHCIIRVTKGNNSCNSGSWKPLILLPNKTEKLYASMEDYIFLKGRTIHDGELELNCPTPCLPKTPSQADQSAPTLTLQSPRMISLSALGDTVCPLQVWDQNITFLYLHQSTAWLRHRHVLHSFFL